MQQRGWEASSAGKLAVARSYVKIVAPYLSPTLYGLIPVPVEGLVEKVGGPLGVTEKMVLLYEPKWVAEEDDLILATGLAHECLHVQLFHATRGNMYASPKRFNRAADLFINGTMAGQQRQVKRRDAKGTLSTVTEPTWKFPDWALMPENFGFPKGLSADEYYRLLEKHDKEHETCSDGILMSGCCGGIAGNPHARSVEEEFNKSKGRSEVECKRIAKETARAIKQHIEESRGRGSLPGEWAELIEISDNVFEVPWRAELANVARFSVARARTGGLDFSMSRPSKRSLLRGIPLPGLVSYDPEIFFIVDSSGSMGTDQLADALRVIADVLTQTGIREAWFMEADTVQRRDPIRVSPHQLASIEILGRGGTSFIPAIEFVTKEFRPRPSIVFYLTDGEGSAPELPPEGIHFVWCIVPTRYKAIPASWGKIIVLDDHIQPEDDEEDEDEVE